MILAKIFDLQHSIEMLDTYFIGMTEQSSAGGLARLTSVRGNPLPARCVYPTGPRFYSFVDPILRLLEQDRHVERMSAGPALGRYGTSQELSVGLDVQAGSGFHAAALAATVFRQARKAKQDDAFVARVLPADEWTDNARPGLTVMFREAWRISSLSPLQRRIMSFPGDGWAIDGFTTIPAEHGRVGMVKGLRYIFLPEISIRWDLELRARLSADIEEMEIILLDQAAKIGRMCRMLRDDPTVAEARLNWLDVIVAGIEDFDAVIESLDAEETVRSADPTSMARKPFSEILSLSNTGVLQQRLDMLRFDRMACPSRAHMGAAA